MKSRIAPLQGIHSARRSYSPGGVYGERDKGRSMAIRYSERAMATQLHPVVKRHAEIGRSALFVNMGYTIGIDGMNDTDATALLTSLRSSRQAGGDSPPVNSRAVSSRLGKGLWFLSFPVRRQSWFRSWAARPRLWSLPAAVHWSHSPRVLRPELTKLMQSSSSSPHSSERWSFLNGDIVEPSGFVG
jgi:hypothetical protein